MSCSAASSRAERDGEPSAPMRRLAIMGQFLPGAASAPPWLAELWFFGPEKPHPADMDTGSSSGPRPPNASTSTPPSPSTRPATPPPRPSGRAECSGPRTLVGVKRAGTDTADHHDLIRVQGARVNNLKDISVEL